VTRIDQRISEAEKLGFEKIIVSSLSKGIDQKKHKIEIIKCSKITEVVKELFA
jgi:DNA repair protein RadA/Sms